MKKVVFTEYGGPEVLQLIDASEPRASKGEVRIAVRAAGVNAHDWRSREGQFRDSHPLEFPAGVGLDASGVVDEIGDGVHGVEIGDHVFGEGHETYSEHAVLHSWVTKPEEVSFVEAAGYASILESALRILRQVGVAPGETLLVNGAAGGVGSVVLQVARERGIKVIGIAGHSNQNYVRSLGATVTTYDGGWERRVRELGRVDAALDVAGSGVVRELVELTGDPQKVISIADLSAPDHGVRFSGASGSVQDALDETVNLIASGRLRVPVQQTYSLTEASAAHIDSQAGHTRGRRVIVV